MSLWGLCLIEAWCQDLGPSGVGPRNKHPNPASASTPRLPLVSLTAPFGGGHPQRVSLERDALCSHPTPQRPASLWWRVIAPAWGKQLCLRRAGAPQGGSHGDAFSQTRCFSTPGQGSHKPSDPIPAGSPWSFSSGLQWFH